ncbi:hypothetical protein BT93_F1694 [Corymbia citriodora subsp. variegata]|nr:hypothetical protein BT93_F1694 [Corymbia citriodora subsp. variegata]
MENQVDAAANAAEAITNASISTNQAAVPPLSYISYAKPFLDISKIEVFNGNNFKRWQERVHSILDVHGVAFALTEAKPTDDKLQDQWIYADKVYRHTIISTLFNELFDVYYVSRQKFVIGNYYRWEMSDDKEIKTQINECRKLLPRSWNDYKQQLKHKDKQLSLADLVMHIIIEDTTRKEIKATKAKEIATKANLTLAFNDVLHVPNIRFSIALLGKFGVKVSLESDKIHSKTAAGHDLRQPPSEVARPPMIVARGCRTPGDCRPGSLGRATPSGDAPRSREPRGHRRRS